MFDVSESNSIIRVRSEPDAALDMLTNANSLGHCINLFKHSYAASGCFFLADESIRLLR